MKRLTQVHPFILVLLFILAGQAAGYAQVAPGIRVNGKLMNPGDSIYVCQGKTVNYQSAAINAVLVSWRFKNGSPSTYNGGSPFNPGFISYGTLGSDTTIQVVSDGTNTDSTFIIVKVVKDPLTASFSFSPNNMCGNIPVQFTNTSSGTGTSYAWSFGDGSTSTAVSPSYPYLNAIGPPGTTQTYSARLIVTDYAGCIDSVKQTVTVQKVPDASLANGDNANVSLLDFNGVTTFKKCASLNNFTFTFLNGSTTIATNTQYTIKWGDGSPDSVFTGWAANAPITHNYPIGNKELTVMVTNASGCIGIKTYNVFLGTFPQGAILGPGNEDICTGDSLTFRITGYANNPPGTLYSVSFNDGSAPVNLHPPLDSTTHYFNTSSCGSVANGVSNAFGASLSITNPCGLANSIRAPIAVSGKARANINTTYTTVCTGTPVSFFYASAFGTVVSNNGVSLSCSAAGKIVWAISPATGWTLQSGSLGSLNGNPVNTAVWVSGTTFITLVFTAPGTYTIKEYVGNTRCGMDSTSRTICVRNPPQASFTMGSKSSCGPGNTLCTNTSPAGGCLGDVYTWSVAYSNPENCGGANGTPYQFINGSTSSSVSPQIQFNTPGRYIIGLTVAAKNAPFTCTSDYKQDTFIVKGKPKVSLAALSSVCVGTLINPTATANGCYSTGPLGYAWTFTGGTPAVSDQAVPGAVSFANAGTFAVQLKVIDSSCNLDTTVSTSLLVAAKPTAFAGTAQTICGGDKFTLGAAGTAGVTYQWSPANGLNNANIANPVLTIAYTGPSPDTTIKYYINASRGAGCASIDSVEITIKRKPVVTIWPLNPAICVNTSDTLVGSGADSYAWTPATGLNRTDKDSVLASPVVTTVYKLTGTLANGCTDTSSVQLVVHPDAKAVFTPPGATRCAPVNLDTVIHTTVFPAGNGVYSWFMNGTPLGNNTSGAMPSYRIDTGNAAITIKLLAQSAYGCKADSMEALFKTVPGVSASFTKNKTSGCGPLAVSFTNTSSALSGINFSWDFGNGGTSTLTQPPPVIYKSSPLFKDTTYYITLKVSNGCNITTYKDSVKVLADPNARVGISSTLGCSPFTPTITNTSAGINTAYYWDYGDGAKDTTYNKNSLTHTYHTGVIDTVIVQLVALNQCGTDTSKLNIVISPNTIQPIIAVNGSDLYGCSPHTATFINSSVGASVLTWDFGDGSPAVFTPNSQNIISHAFGAPGVYTIKIKLHNDCPTDSLATRAVTVYDKPHADFLSTASVCVGQDVATINTSANANGYEWQWSDGTTSPDVNPVHHYNTAGTYNVLLIARKLNGFGIVCADTMRRQVLVVTKIVPQISVPAGSACTPYTLTATAVGAAGASLVEWRVFDSNAPQGGFYSTGAVAVHQYAKPGNYNVKLIVHTVAGCVDSTVYNFVVYETPHGLVAPITVSTCVQDTIIAFKASVNYTGNDPIAFKWYVNDQLKGISNPFSYQFTGPPRSVVPAVYVVKLHPENSNGCGDTSLAGTVTINPLPSPVITVQPGQVLVQPDYIFDFKDAMPAGPNKVYNWWLGDKTGSQRSGREITYEYGDTGVYKVRLYVRDAVTGCDGSDSVQVTILYVAGYMYVPNAICPGCGVNAVRAFLPIAKGLKEYRLRIFTIWGQKVFETTSLDNNGAPNEAWNGRWEGNKSNPPVQQDAYTWQIEAKFVNGTEWKGMLYPGNSQAVKSGFVTVIR